MSIWKVVLFVFGLPIFIFGIFLSNWFYLIGGFLSMILGALIE